MRFYVGTYTRMGGPGICICTLENGRLHLLDAVRDMNDPTYVILDGGQRTLLAVGSDPATGEGMVASYAVEGDRLMLTGMQPTGGKAPCHLTLDAQERTLYVANYLSGSVSVFPVRDRQVLARTQLVEHQGRSVHSQRQEAAHTHQCVFRPGTAELFVCDLGMDAIMIYDSDTTTGALALKAVIDTPPGMGPRHLTFASPDTFYVAGELDNCVMRYGMRGGVFRPEGRARTVPEGAESTLAAIRLRNGRVYASNRGYDTVTVLSEGLALLEQVPCGGKAPRDFDFTAQGELLIANQDGGGVVLAQKAALPIRGAVCICLTHTKE